MSNQTLSPNYDINHWLYNNLGLYPSSIRLLHINYFPHESILYVDSMLLSLDLSM